MPRAKRQYIPKIRGCYECSQRRIHCDRGEPRCAKCIVKGLQCSGLGIRYRFENDKHNLPTHQFLQSGKIQSRSTKSAYQQNNHDFFSYEHRELCYRDTSPRIRSDPPKNYNNDVSSSNPVDLQSSTDKSREYRSFDSSSDLLARDMDWGFVCPYDTLNPGQSHMLLYFGQYIAPELVIIDDQRNGWRHLILPIARLDDLVMDAVVSAAVFHFEAKFQNFSYSPSGSYARAIRSLRERQDLATQDRFGRQNVLTALLVLLATVMVNGSADFPTIFGLLESALEAAGGEDAVMVGELGYFLVKQIRKYRGYAAPLLSQSKGLSRLCLSAGQARVIGQNMANGWDCFLGYYQSYPEWSKTLSVIYELNKQACEIYIARVRAGPEGAPLTDKVTEFRQILESLPAGAVGEHILVFATFIAAAESVLPADQEFFVGELLKHYRRNGFANILSAVSYLQQRIWVKDAVQQDWTRRLPELQVFIV